MRGAFVLRCARVRLRDHSFYTCRVHQKDKSGWYFLAKGCTLSGVLLDIPIDLDSCNRCNDGFKFAYCGS
jgi:hypothetical protein